MNRLIVVSNRLAIPDKPNSAPGGLAVGIQSALNAHGGIWFGWSGNISPPADCNRLHIETYEDTQYIAVDLTQHEHHTYYQNFSNKILWPLLHFVLGFMHYHRSDYDGYKAVNRRFAGLLVTQLQPDDIIWVHDYHLLPLASELRKQRVNQAIGFFLHVPFPAYDMWRSLPVARELLDQLCHYDVVGFQTENDLLAFCDSVKQCLSAESLIGDCLRVNGKIIKVMVCPIGIDYDTIQANVSGSNEDQNIQALMALSPQKMIIGADRLDYSKGLPDRFEGYRHFLKSYPQYEKKWRYMQIATISRGSDPHYIELRENLEKMLGAINGQFGDIDWTPISYLNKSIPHNQLMCLFRYADIGLVTSLRDGMNLVAKEYVAAQSEENPGVLVLSELAGAARELNGAIQVNPYDHQAIAEGLQQAIEMPLEARRERYQDMVKVLRRQDIHAWRTQFVSALIQQSEVRRAVTGTTEIGTLETFESESVHGT